MYPGWPGEFLLAQQLRGLDASPGSTCWPPARSPGLGSRATSLISHSLCSRKQARPQEELSEYRETILQKEHPRNSPLSPFK